MDMKNVNYAIQYIKENYHSAKITESNIEAVRRQGTFRRWLEKKLREEGIEQLTFKGVVFGEPYRTESWHSIRDDEEISYRIPF